MVAGAAPGNPVEGGGDNTEPALAACEEKGSNAGWAGGAIVGVVCKVVVEGGCKR